MQLPDDFLTDISQYMDKSEFDKFVHALSETEQTTCIRMNLSKSMTEEQIPKAEGLKGANNLSVIGWNPETGRYLKERPVFTTDPLLHAGCYYVQEASSQFIGHVIKSLIHENVNVLDLCAAPGGKSIALLSSLPEGSQLVSNEIDRRRARILSENITKWGSTNVTVTCNAPKDFRKLRQLFDVIVTDVPCSGEGMFRKDEGAIKDWSAKKVKDCANLQREIVETIWPCLKPGGLLIYSTCTFNVHEDEENIAWICENLGGESIEVPTEIDWQIHAPLIGSHPCYRFMPHFTQGEGLFMACIRKNSDEEIITKHEHKGKSVPNKKNNTKLPQINYRQWVDADGEIEMTAEGELRLIPTSHKELHNAIIKEGLYILQSGIELGTMKGKDMIPAHALALSKALKENAFPKANVNLETALNYLRREAISLPDDTPTGHVLVCYKNHPLGFVKNMGNRCNNIYPQEWRIRFC